LLGEASVPQKPKKKGAGIKGLSIMNTIFSVLAVVTFIVGFVFLCIAEVRGSRYYYDEFNYPHYHYFGFIDASFGLNGADDSFEIIYLFTTIGAILSAICLVIQFFCTIAKNKNATKSIIIDVLTLLSLTVAIVFGFLSLGELYADEFALVFSILVSSACLFVLVHLIFSIIIKSKNQTSIK
jgi:heme A synthase